MKETKNTWIIRKRRVELELETDIDDESLKSLKWWEDLTHTDEFPYFLITALLNVQDLGEENLGE